MTAPAADSRTSDSGNAAARLLYALARYGESLSTALPALAANWALTSAEYGRFTVAYSVAIVVSALLASWARAGVLRDVLETDRAFWGLRSRRFAVALGASFLCTASVVSLVLDDASRFLVTASALAASSLGFGAAVTAIQTIRKSYRAYFATEAMRATIIAMALGVGLQHDSAATVMLGVFLAALVPRGFWAALTFGKLHIVAKIRPRSVASAWFTYGWPLAFFSGLSLANQYSDRLIMARVMTVDIAGMYAFAYDIVLRVPVFLVGPLVILRFLDSNRAHDLGDRPKARAIAVRAGIQLVGCAFLWTIFVAFLIPSVPIVGKSAVIGDSFGVRTLLALGTLPLLLQLVVVQPYVLQKRLPALLLPTGLGLVVNLGLNVVLIPRFGMTGAAVSTLISGVSLILLVLRGTLGWWLEPAGEQTLMRSSNG